MSSMLQSSDHIQTIIPHTDLAGSLPIFPEQPGDEWASSLELPSLQRKQLVFNRLVHPGQIHVYRANCIAGGRLRVQMYVPMLPVGGSVAPAFAVIGRSLPYSADTQKLPIELPAGYSAVVAPSPSELMAPVADALTRVKYYPGPLIDTRTLVGGDCYIVVWSPHHHMGKYVLQVGHRWPLRWTYWAQLPLFWWQIRGWFGLSRMAAYLAGGLLLVIAFIASRWGRGRDQSEDQG